MIFAYTFYKKYMTTKNSGEVSATPTQPFKIDTVTMEKENKILRRENEILREQIRTLKEEMYILRMQPSMIGTIQEIHKDKVIVDIVGHPQLVATIPKRLCDIIKVSQRVVVDPRSLAIIDILDEGKDTTYQFELQKKPDVTYKDVGGQKKALDELKEVVELPLKHPERFRTLGIRPYKGVLIYGPPGVGKTLIARATAGETGATFIKISGSDLIQKYIGEGPKLVSRIFEVARKKAPTIIFIDEIDAIGGKRTYDSSGAQDEIARTLTQLLVEIDGFDSVADGIFVIGATNIPENLDPALLRSGRLERHIKIGFPTKEDRAKIFGVCLRDMKVNKGVSATKLAEMSGEKTGADIKKICTEAGIVAINENAKEITTKHFKDAMEKYKKQKESSVDLGLYK